MNEVLLPENIFQFLASRVLGQEDVLRKVSVAIYKHINGLKAGNILLIGNSGTGKTTIMNSIQKFFMAHRSLRKYSAMSIMNANMLAGEDIGDVDLQRLIKSLEVAVNNSFGVYTTDDKLCEYMQNATVCIDEIDKISATISGKPNVVGIAIQQALLTMLEGERILYETVRHDQGQKRKTRLFIDSSKMFFICGGAFEGLYDQIVHAIKEGKDDRKLRVSTGTDPRGNKYTREVLVLRDQVRLADLFTYGMTPQFISRFHSIAVLEDLGVNELQHILLSAEDSPLRHSHNYFKSMDIDLMLTKEAVQLITEYAVENTRIGARALREVFNRIITPFEFDPFQSDKLVQKDQKTILTIDKDVVLRSFG